MPVVLKMTLVNWAAIIALWAPVYLSVLDSLGHASIARSELFQWALVAVGLAGLAGVITPGWKDTRDPDWRAAHQLPRMPSLPRAKHRRHIADADRRTHFFGQGHDRHTARPFRRLRSAFLDVGRRNHLDQRFVVGRQCDRNRARLSKPCAEAAPDGHGARNGGGDLLRLAFASVVSSLLVIPYLKIVGGAALLWIDQAPGQ